MRLADLNPFRKKKLINLPEMPAPAKPKKKFKWWKHLKLKRDDKSVDAVDQLMDNSRLEASFFVMCGLSGALATIGLLLNDTAILIAAMILAPLLNPVLALAAGLSIMNYRLIRYAARSFFGSIFFVILTSFALVKFFVIYGEPIPVSVIQPSLDKFAQLDHYLFLAAFISGFSGLYAWLKATNASNFVGVAIAVSLIPFVSFFGILLALEMYDTIDWYAMTFTVNIFSIVLGALLAFLSLGFSHHKREISKEVEKNENE